MICNRGVAELEKVQSNLSTYTAGACGFSNFVSSGESATCTYVRVLT
jgi:hypothetical protein